MSDQPKKKKKTATQNKIDKDMANPSGEHLVPLKTGLNKDETWVKKFIRKTR